MLFLVWWFTRDVTYVGNVKVSGLEGISSSQQAPLRALADDMAALVNELVSKGYAWRAGGLPALRAHGALSAEEQARALALGFVAVNADKTLLSGDEARQVALFLRSRGWELAGEDPLGLNGATTTRGQLRAVLEVRAGREGSEELTMVITAH